MAQRPLTGRTVLKKLAWLLPALFLYVLSQIAFKYPQATERVYAQGIFPFIMQPISAILGVLPFSIGEILLYALLLLLLFFVATTPLRAFRAGKDWYKAIADRLLSAVMIIAVLFTAFLGMFGLCYARQPLSQTLALNTAPASAQELYETAQALVAKANALRVEIGQTEVTMASDYNRRMQILRAIPSYYDEVAKKTGYAFLGGAYGPVKPVLYSTGLSYAFIEGVYCPFTGEANINVKMPITYFASTALHEAAHQRGFAREDEANFLAYYVGSQVEDIDVRYSATMLAMTYAMNALSSANGELYDSLAAKINEDIWKDMDESSQFWKQYQGTVSEASAKVNDGYLKANSQQDGIQSYGAHGGSLDRAVPAGRDVMTL